jgi:hypothetical protein
MHIIVARMLGGMEPCLAASSMTDACCGPGVYLLIECWSRTGRPFPATPTERRQRLTLILCLLVPVSEKGKSLPPLALDAVPSGGHVEFGSCLSRTEPSQLLSLLVCRSRRGLPIQELRRCCPALVAGYISRGSDREERLKGVHAAAFSSTALPVCCYDPS